ncbi:hypothetical protein AAII07_56160 [Microvirga sp. 0TCS3.31]
MGFDEEALEIRRRVLLTVRVDQDVPRAIVGQPASLLERSECRFARGRNRSVLILSSYYENHRFLDS